jgi:predicted RNA methylase
MTLTAPLPRARVAPPLADAETRALLDAARALGDLLSRRETVTAPILSSVMTRAFGASDAVGGWSWRMAYDAAEAAQVIALRRLSAGETRRNPAALLALAEAIAAACPAQSRRSEAQLRLQQFSTPLPLAVVAAVAARLRPGERVLEPSCGTGTLASAAHVLGASLVLNELDPRRRLLAGAALGVDVSEHDAAFIADLLDTRVRPGVVLMNPPFAASAARAADPGLAARHLLSALKTVAPGGRCVAIMPAAFAGGGGADATARRIAEIAHLRLRLALPAASFQRQGTSVDATLCVFDRRADAAADGALPEAVIATAPDLDAALTLVRGLHRSDAAQGAAPTPAAPVALSTRGRSARSTHGPDAPASPTLALRREAPQPLVFTVVEPEAMGQTAESGLYEGYRLRRLAIPGACAHPTPLVESSAMAATLAPAPTVAPLVPPSLVRRGALSDAQLETLIYAATAFEADLPGAVIVDDSWREATAAAPDRPGAVRLRRGFFLGDGTGCGKGRQVAGVILDAFARGHRRAVWVSKSDKLIEDAVRDWTALGGDAADIQPLGRWKLGASIGMAEGILFVTYATLRVGPRQGKDGRLEQIVDWLAGGSPRASGSGGREAFEGVIAFDEAHAMGGAGGLDGARGRKAGSQQGVAGLRLQYALPRARVLYVSATGATTVENLAYATRLGLWGEGDYPFQSREAFVRAMVAGGVAAMEIVARDLKALGVYVARALSFEGVEQELLEHRLTPAQVAIYDAYADAFQLIHANLAKAMEATGITCEGTTQDRTARSAALSRFESLKQRFFNHLLTGMKTPALLDAIAARLDEGMSVVVQLVSTGEALLDRRLDALPEAEHADLAIDLTPREYVIEYLREAFPTELRRVCEDENGDTFTEIVTDADGRPVQCREAVALREAMIEQLCLLAPVQTALDQILWRFGHAAVAEATGRSRRVLRVQDAHGAERLRVERRSASANSAETRAFMSGEKRILVFSEAGGTGRSYHADRDAPNTARRAHFLLEAGWRADTAIQGLGRTHRANQVSAPLFLPVTTDVKGEKRFISTISRRLDSLGALTKGAARTGGQGLFRPEDNLEGRIAKASLRAFYAAIANGAAQSIGLEPFQRLTGLTLIDDAGALLDELPPITRFLNRILALRIATQNAIFDEFAEIVAGRVAQAEAAGLSEGGVEALRADGAAVIERRVLRCCPTTAAETLAWRIRLSWRIDRPSAEAMAARLEAVAEPVVNARSRGVAFRTPHASLYLDDGTIERQVRLVRPRGREVMRAADYAESAWEPCPPERFAALWAEAVAALPETETEEIAMITGLVLPVWKHLPEDEQRIRRLTTDCGQALIGRIVTLDPLGEIAGVLSPTEGRDAAAIARAVMIENRVVPLAQGASLRRRLVGQRQRCEIETPPADMIRALKAAGCFVEIIQYRARVFVKLDAALSADGVAALDAVLALLPPAPR